MAFPNVREVVKVGWHGIVYAELSINDSGGRYAADASIVWGPSHRSPTSTQHCAPFSTSAIIALRTPACSVRPRKGSTLLAPPATPLSMKRPCATRSPSAPVVESPTTISFRTMASSGSSIRGISLAKLLPLPVAFPCPMSRRGWNSKAGASCYIRSIQKPTRDSSALLVGRFAPVPLALSTSSPLARFDAARILTGSGQGEKSQ